MRERYIILSKIFVLNIQWFLYMISWWWWQQCVLKRTNSYIKGVERRKVIPWIRFLVDWFSLIPFFCFTTLKHFRTPRNTTWIQKEGALNAGWESEWIDHHSCNRFKMNGSSSRKNTDNSISRLSLSLPFCFLSLYFQTPASSTLSL